MRDRWRIVAIAITGSLASISLFAATANYRSIGTAPDYTTGTVAVTNGSGLVTGTGTAWKGANRGRGDRMRIGAVDYVVGQVVSDTQLYLTTPYSGATASSLAYTLARQFTTLQGWEDCISFGSPCTYFPVASASLVADDRSEVGIAYKDSVFTLTSGFTINGATTDATHTITLTADGINRHNGTPGAGVIVDQNLGRNEILIWNVGNVTLEWLELRRIRAAGGSPAAIRVSDPGAVNVLLQNLLIHDFNDPTGTIYPEAIRLSGAAGKSLTVRNTMIWDGDAVGIQGDEVTDTLVVENCSVDNMQDTTAPTRGGIYTDLTQGVIVRNTIATGSGTDFNPTGGSFAAGPTSTSNTSSDATAPGANPQTAVTASALFVTPNVDLHLKSGAPAIDTALDLSSSFVLDVDGQQRPAGAGWDRGADERAAAVNYRSIGAYSTGDASVTAATTTVLFAGGASLPADVQPGDQITLNPGGGSEETLTVATRDSATQLTLAGPAASTHTNEPYLLFWQYTTGDATVALGSTTVTFGSGASLPAKSGLGDQLVIGGETLYVLSRDSATQVTVASPATVAHTAVAYTLQRAYQTLQNWEDDRQGDLVAENRREVGVAYKDGPFDPPYEIANSALVINGSNTDAGHFMWLTAAPGNRHNGTAGTGVLLDGLGVTKFGIQDEDDYSRIDSLELARFKIAGGSGFASLVAIGVNSTYSNLLVYDFQEPTGTGDGIRTSQTVGGWNFTLRNSIIYNGDRSGVRVDETTSSATVENVTVYGMETTGVAVGSGGGILTATNTISMDNGTSSFDAGSGTMIQSYDLSSDGTAAGTGSIVGKASINQFVSITPGSEDLHLKAGADAVDTGLDLSGSFCCDIDGGIRVVPWDIGADDLAAATAVELVELDARGLDGAVELHWKTGSEMDNLGFQLYRSMEENGEYQRITTSLIPGLGSSPEGAAYVYRDSGLSNDTVYFYKLEDIETTGRTKLHGPVSATPHASSGASAAEEPEPEEGESRITFGNPSANRFEVLRWDRWGAVVELTTEGFYAEPLEDGSVLLEVPDFERISTATGPALPVRRPWVDAIAGIDVRLVSVEERDPARFSSLRPSGADTYEAFASERGVVRAARHVRRAVLEQPGLFPATAARIVTTGFQGEVKKVQLELAPLRWNGEKSELQLSRRLIVRLAFRGRVQDETASASGRGRRRPRHPRADGTALVRLVTTEAGLHAIRFERLFGSRRKGYDTGALRLSRLGETVSFHVEPDPLRFGPGSTLYFLSPGPEANAYGDELVFDLQLSADGTRMALTQARPSGPPVDSYRSRLRLETNRYYQAGLPASDHWFWDLLMSATTNRYSFDLDAVAPSVESGRLLVALQGASDFPVSPDHHLRVYVNGVLVGEDSWEGKNARAIEGELPPCVLVEGTNTVELENVGDTEAAYSMVFLDRIEVDYPRPTLASAGTLEGTWTRSGSAVVSGADARAPVLDVTDEARPVWLTNVSEAPTGELSFRAEENRRYLVTTPESVLVPEVRRPATNALETSREGVDYLLIGPAEFSAAAEPLAELRRSQGLRSRFVSIEQIEDEFGFGEPRPEALRDFLIHAYHDWPAPALRYVVLLGDGTYDYKDFLQTGVRNQVPPLMIQTSYLWTASDPTFAMVNGDDQLPDIAIGRLPAKNVDELRVMIEKILAFESGAASLYSTPFVLVADNPDKAGDFVAQADDIGTLVPPPQSVDKLYLSELGRTSIRNEILRSLDEGASVMSYIGHGGIQLWADEQIFTLDDVTRLGAQGQQPLFLTMNCLNGYFDFPYFDSLSEALVKADGMGAIAAFSPSGLSLDAPAHLYHRALVNALFHGNYERLGDAVLAAQQEYAASGAFPELLAIYHLFGDPALRLK